MSDRCPLGYLFNVVLILFSILIFLHLIIWFIIIKNINNPECPSYSGILKWRYTFKPSSIRWTPAAEDIVFSQPWHTFFFTLGRVIPLCRGDGVFQKTMDFCVEQLNKGGWVHMFPEGKVLLLLCINVGSTSETATFCLKSRALKCSLVA